MCIRDSLSRGELEAGHNLRRVAHDLNTLRRDDVPNVDGVCLLYTSDAADDLLCVDLGGRRIIK